MTANVLISSFAPFPTFSLHVPSETCISDIFALVGERLPVAADDLWLSHGAATLKPGVPISSLLGADLFVSLRVVPRLRGGKGGFGSQLRAAGGRMSSLKTSNNDSCRDLSGRRLSTLKEAKKLADYMASEPERKKAVADARKAKLEALEKKLGIESSSSAGEPSTSKKFEPPKRRFDDTAFLEETRDIVDGVKDAVAAGLKKRKKAKLAAATATKADPTVDATGVVEAVLQSSATGPVAAAAAIAVGVATA